MFLEIGYNYREKVKDHENGVVPMIYTTLSGRCGNQLFAYAMAREIQFLTRDDTIVLCDGNLLNENKNDPSFANDLISFNIKNCKISHECGRQVFLHGSFVQRIVYLFFKVHCKFPYKKRIDFYKRQERWQPILNRVCIYEIIHGFSKIRFGKQKNKFIYRR